MSRKNLDTLINKWISRKLFVFLIASGFTPNSIGDRLQNASTVATTGGQIASYNI
jgi:hypothetical protein